MTVPAVRWVTTQQLTQESFVQNSSHARDSGRTWWNLLTRLVARLQVVTLISPVGCTARCTAGCAATFAAQLMHSFLKIELSYRVNSRFCRAPLGQYLLEYTVSVLRAVFWSVVYRPEAPGVAGSCETLPGIWARRPVLKHVIQFLRLSVYDGKPVPRSHPKFVPRTLLTQLRLFKVSAFSFFAAVFNFLFFTCALCHYSHGVVASFLHLQHEKDNSHVLVLL